MFEIGWTEMLVIAIVMIVVVGPKDLPKMLRQFGRTTSKLRVMAGDFGGPNGLAEYLEAECIDAVVDATHPFAAQLSGSAIAASVMPSGPSFAVVAPMSTPPS